MPPRKKIKSFTVLSRYKVPRHITQLSPHQYRISGKATFIRASSDLIDFEGGPLLQVGDDFYGLGLIQHIDFPDSSESPKLGIAEFLVTLAPNPQKTTSRSPKKNRRTR